MSKNRKIKDTSAGSGGGDNARRREVLGVLGLGAALFLLVAMISLQAGRMVMGPFGRSSAGLFYGFAGVCGYVLIGLALVAAVRMLLERDPVMPGAIAVGAVIGVVSLATLVHLAAAGYRVAGHGPGGLVGEHLAEVLRAVISTAGTALLGCVGLVVAAVVATPLRMRDVLRAIGRALRAVGRAGKAALGAFLQFWSDVARAILPEKRGEFDDEVEAADDDVLEVGDTDRVADPQIIERR
ncbi:MAG TPA: DNA translocase FtsK 4TM domain-containing protein, partial [Kofleriaceae bacterium]|nr:DNA translocase FtsK 4TM domain-containing protein [Kofleriaceae bacterium]